MRSEEDIILVNMTLEGTIELDVERIEADPNWRTISGNFNLPEELNGALAEYLKFYIIRDRLLREMPSTNGPGELKLTKFATAQIISEESTHVQSSGTTGSSNSNNEGSGSSTSS